MKRVKKGLSVSILCALIICFGQFAQAAPSGELRIGLPTLFDQTFHPIWANAYRAQYIGPMYDYIVGTDKDGNFVPEQSVAYNWETSSDLLTWTFYIRQGIKFHNGDPLTPEDVKYTIEQAGTKKNVAGRRAEFQSFVDRIETAPPDKVIVYLKKPWITFLYYLSDLVGVQGMVQPKKYLMEKGEKHFMSNPVGSGPYRFHEWKEGDYIKLVAQDSHWRIKTPRYKYLTFKLKPEQGTRVAALRAGELDIASIGLSDLQTLKDAGHTIRQKKDGLLLDLSFLRLWRDDWPTSKQKVRQALIMAIDKKEIVDQILMGQGNVIGTTLALFPWAFDYKPFPHTPYDPEKAKKLLKEAGYPRGFTIYHYSFVTKLPETKIINEAIAGYWEAIGVKTKLLEMGYSAFKPVWIKKKDAPGPCSFLMAWPNRSVYSWRGKYYSGKLFSNTKDPNLDKMIGEVESKTTLDGYIPKSQDIMAYVLDQAYATGVCTTHELYATGKNVPLWEMGKSFGTYRWEYIGQ